MCINKENIIKFSTIPYTQLCKFRHWELNGIYFTKGMKYERLNNQTEYLVVHDKMAHDNMMSESMEHDHVMHETMEHDHVMHETMEHDHVMHENMEHDHVMHGNVEQSVLWSFYVVLLWFAVYITNSLYLFVNGNATIEHF